MMTPFVEDLSVEHHVNLRGYNTFGINAIADTLVRIRSVRDVRRLVDHPQLGRRRPHWILGGGSNVVLTNDIEAVVLKIEIQGMHIVHKDDAGVLIDVGAGVLWHDFVSWTVLQGLGGLENLALIPGTVGAAPVQNIGAYGMEVADRIVAVYGVDLITGRAVEISAQQCQFGYRDSIFKRDLAGKTVITHVRFFLPLPWQARVSYLDLQRQCESTGISAPDASTIFNWVCQIRQAKLPDPAQIGNAGSYFKNPVVSWDQCQRILDRYPKLVHYPLNDQTCKLAAGWMIDACGWKGRNLGAAGVHSKQALVLVNLGQATGADILQLAKAIQNSVQERFGVQLEPEPVMMPAL